MSSATGGQFADVPMPVRIESDLSWLIVMPDGESALYSRYGIKSATERPITIQEQAIDYLCRRLTGQS